MAETVAAQLDKSRRSLLDLSTRNRLLSLPRKASSKLINIYDEKSAEIYRLLVADGKSLTFLPGQAETSEAAAQGDDESGVYLPQPADEETEAAGVATRHRDTKLQTKLASDKLQHRLLEMYYDARTFIEEQGVNILYLGLGQLKWFDANAAEKERCAPLILVPVTLERKSAAERFHLSWMQEDAAENLSLAAKLKTDFGIALPEFKAGDDFEPNAYLEQVAQAVAGQSGWQVVPDAVVLGFFSFAKFLMYRDLDPANWPEEKRVDRQALIVAALQDGFPAAAQLFPEDVSVDELIPVAEQRHVVDADSSQSLAIEAVRSGRSLVIQGPPGTGKSQTITNIIAAAVADGKKVLFVSEKMAALDVVHRRLSAVGLAPACLELHSNRTNKRRVLEELKATLDLGKPKVEQRERIIDELDQTRAELNGHAERMHTPLAPSGLSPYSVIGHLVRLSDIRLSGLPPLLDRPESWTPQDLQARRDLARDFRQKAEKVGSPAAHPWRGVQHDSLLKLEADRLLDDIRAVQRALSQLELESIALANTLSVPAGDTLHAIAEQTAIGRRIGTAPLLDRRAVAHSIWSGGLRALEQLVQSGERFAAALPTLEHAFTDSAWRADLDASRRDLAAHGDSLLRFFNGDYRRAVATLKSYLKTPLPKTLPERLALVDALIESQRLRRGLAERDADGQAAFGSLWQGERSDWAQLRFALRWLSGEDGQGLTQDFRSLYARLPDPQACARQGEATEPALAQARQALATLFGAYRLDLREAFAVDELDAVPLEDLENRLQNWLNNADHLFDWIQYGALRRLSREQGLGELSAQYESGAVALQHYERSFERAYYEQLLRDFSQREPALYGFDGELHNNKVQAFRTLDRRRIELARAEAALEHYRKMPGGNGGIGPMGVLNGEIARKRGHMPLRRLFKLAGDAVQAIKPVFMMSPLSVAQFLEPGALEFDMLVIDEASQIEPVDALGAIARCKQLVVVGDDKQLPPTRFFSRMTTDSEIENVDEDEAYIAGAGDVESILSLCLAKGMPQLMLRWHYRSRHQSLIAVSNREFYHDELYIVPSPYTQAAGVGLRFHHVADGSFDSGGTRVNRIEAKRIAQAIIQHALGHPELSLGVAAFSLQQKIAIQDELEVLRRQHPEIEPFFNAHPNEPFFVKNLENVQGDERDVIFISVAYARTPAGALPMRFGPVGMDGGERRLNVLISRAKQRCEVFSSITADDIDLSRVKGKGVAALKVFLAYAAGGALPGAPRALQTSETIFEQEVKQALEAEGLAVQAHIGIAGFFVDLAVADPLHPGRYLLGIECDGLGYRRARSARDRDRLRQAVLEDQGWLLYRVWSADWFRQPQAELRKLLVAVEAAKAEIEARAVGSLAAKAAPPRVPYFADAVDREAEPSGELDLPHSIMPYQEATLPVPTQYELPDVPPSRLAELVRKVVDIEGPIHFEEVLTRLRTLWGLQRSGPKIREALSRARQFLLENRLIVEENDFIDLPDRPARVRHRGKVGSAGLRKADYLPPAEIRAAILSVLRDNLGGQRDELPAAVGKLLGLGVVNASAKDTILGQVDALQRSGAIQLGDGVYRAT